MAIRWVINGYFRSGTTFMWERFRKGVSGDVLCLYEPLHPDLPDFLNNQGRDKSGKRLHKLDLWSDYIRIPSDQRELLLKHHPNRSGNCNWSCRKLTDYLEILHSLDKDVMIQANRLHYNLTDVVETTGAQVVHIVRNPMDVFYSIRHTYFTNVGRFRGFARRVAYPFRGSRAFETVQWMNRAMNVSPQLSTALKNRPQGFLPCFVPAWISANYAAIQSAIASQGVICVYEEMFLRATHLTETLQRYLGVPFSIEREVVKPRSENNRNGNWKRFNKWVKNWGLETEWKAIKKVAEVKGVEWR